VPDFEPPVAVNAEPPVRYPPQLFREGVEGTVVLLLFADETGHLVLDSTRIHDGSGYAALDSAVLSGVDAMEFAPARRNGQPVSTWFLQPVHFRLPEPSTAGGGL
jgi:protein TonB